MTEVLLSLQSHGKLWLHDTSYAACWRTISDVKKWKTSFHFYFIGPQNGSAHFLYRCFQTQTMNIYMSIKRRYLLSIQKSNSLIQLFLNTEQSSLFRALIFCLYYLVWRNSLFNHIFFFLGVGGWVTVCSKTISLRDHKAAGNDRRIDN